MILSSINETELARITQSVTSYEIERRFPSVGYLELMLSADCNLRCDYCFVKKKRPDHMTVEIMRKSIDLLTRASKKLKDVGILFFGGEPLLRLDLIQETVSYARDVLGAANKTVKFDMTTNGTLLDDKKTQYLARAGIKYLLSLDGDREDHDAHRRTRDGRGSFDLTMSNFKLMKSYQPWQGARMTVHPDNSGRIYHNILKLHERGIYQFIIGPAHGAGWTFEQIEQFEEQMHQVFDYYLEQKKAGRYIRIVLYEQGNLEALPTRYNGAWGCGAGRGRLCVTPDGCLYGCSKLATINGVGKGILPLGDVWSGFNNAQPRSLLCDGTDRRRIKCHSCKISERCTGNCPATNYVETGNIFESGPEGCAFSWVYDRMSDYATKRLKETGQWQDKEKNDAHSATFISSKKTEKEDEETMFSTSNKE